MTDLKQLGGYQIEAHLGSGRYTDVYRATDTIRKRSIALKVLKPGLLADPQVQSRFIKQAQQAAELVHPHIAWVWETGESNGLSYLIVRYVNGPSLANSVALPWERTLQIMRQVAQALDFAHGRGQVHGGIRPQNILVSPDLGAVLTDFGLDQALMPAEVQELPATMRYTAPEIWLGKALTPASDLYALACVWVELLSGMPLFSGSNAAECQAQHLAPVTLPPFLPIEVPQAFEAALKRALMGKPGERFASAGDFIAAAESSAPMDPQIIQEIAERRQAAIAWQAAREKTRQEAEEAARQAALEQARREIVAHIIPAEEEQQEEIQEAEKEKPEPGAEEAPAVVVGATAGQPAPPVSEMPASKTPAVPLPIVSEVRPASTAGSAIKKEPLAGQSLAAPPRAGKQPPRRRWMVWAVSGFAILVLVGLWISGMLPGAPEFFAATPTLTASHTSLPPSPTQTTVSAPTATKTAAPTASDTPSPTDTATHTATRTPSITPTPSITQTPTLTATRTRTPTPTRTPRDDDEDQSPFSPFPPPGFPQNDGNP